MKRLILLLGLLLVAGPAHASSVWHWCSSASVTAATASGRAPDTTVTTGTTKCFYFNADDNSAVIKARAPNTLICLDPNVASDGADVAEVMIRLCPGGVSTYDANLCLPILDASLDGTGGSATTQNACLRVGPGDYVVVNTANGTPDESFVSFRGE